MKLMHTTEVRALVELQNKDRAVDDLAAKISSVPGKIQALTDVFEEKKNSMNAAKETLVKLQVEKKAKELAAAEKDEEIRKHQRDLNMVKENDAFKALLSEIETAKKAKDDIETGILGLMDAVDKAAVEDKKLQAEVRKLEEEKNRQIKDLETEKIKFEAALEAAKGERAGAAAKISEAVLEKYEFIRAKRHGVAIVQVKEDKVGKISCGGCNMGLTAQKVVDVKTHDALVFCEDCQRMIYLDKTIYG